MSAAASASSSGDTTLVSQTLPEKIAVALAEQVIEGRYAPGERLVEARLTKHFKVSHGPVRDALRILQNAGLVTIHPYRGAQVTELSVQEVTEIYQVRAALVGLRARWIAEDPDREKLLATIAESIAGLDALAKDEQRAADYVVAARRLNRLLTESVSNRWLRTMLQSLTLQTARYTRLALTAPERRRESARLWRRLLDALVAGDGENAQAIASRISLATRDAAIRYLRETGAAGPN